MSWDIEIITPACAHCGVSTTIEIGNYTHNCNAMVYAALRAARTLDALDGSLHALDSMECVRVVEILEPAMLWWDGYREAQAELNPPNGWGDEPGARQFWWTVVRECKRHPDARLAVSG